MDPVGIEPGFSALAEGRVDHLHRSGGSEMLGERAVEAAIVAGTGRLTSTVCAGSVPPTVRTGPSLPARQPSWTDSAGGRTPAGRRSTRANRC
jgi:hypothetical protein